MRKIVYYVAMTLDGYISGPNESIDGYLSEGSGLETYLNDLKAFDTVIMGRKTYEFGFKYGVIPGLPAYEHMDHYIFSDTASYENSHTHVKIIKRDLEIMKELKKGKGTDIYLCGGGLFAGWLLENEVIDVLKIKLSSAVFVDGTRLFGDSKKKVLLDLTEQQQHDHGMIILTYDIK